MKHHKDNKKGQYPHLAKASLLLLGVVLVIGITSHIERGVWSKKLAEAEKGSASECLARIDAANELVNTRQEAAAIRGSFRRTSFLLCVAVHVFAPVCCVCA